MQCVNDEIIQPCERSICECNRFFAENYGKMFLDEFKTKNQNFEENNAKCGEISQSNLPNKKYQLMKVINACFWTIYLNITGRKRLIR